MFTTNKLAERDDTIRPRIVFTLSNQPVSHTNKQTNKKNQQDGHSSIQPGKEAANYAASHQVSQASNRLLNVAKTPPILAVYFAEQIYFPVWETKQER